MAITIDNSGQADSIGTGTTITISDFVVGSGSNRYLLVGVSLNVHSGDGPTEVVSVAFGVASFDLIGTETQGDDARIEIWELIAPAESTADIVVTTDAHAGNAGIVAGAVSFFGVHQTVPTSAMSSDVGEGTTPTVDISSAANELVFDTMAMESLSTETERWSLAESTDDDMWGAGSTEPGAGSVTMSWSHGVGDWWAIGAIAIKPAAVAAGNPWYAYAQQ
jgi:hypothetical protein